MGGVFKIIFMSKRERGRPSKYDPKMLPIVEKMMSEGASKVEVCAELGISYETLTEWCDLQGAYFNRDFSESIKRGERLSEAWWEKHGRSQLENPKFNATLWYMNMKNRFGWRDRQEVDAKVDGKINVVCNIPLSFEKEESL